MSCQRSPVSNAATHPAFKVISCLVPESLYRQISTAARSTEKSLSKEPRLNFFCAAFSFLLEPQINEILFQLMLGQGKRYLILILWKNREEWFLRSDIAIRQYLVKGDESNDC